MLIYCQHVHFILPRYITASQLEVMGGVITSASE